jgi:hypothetical protein
MAEYKDLLKDTSTAIEDGNYFNVTITDLQPNTSYPIQIRWKYKDGTYSDWSSVKRLSPVTAADSPSVNPSVPTVASVLGAINLTWNGKTSTGGDQPYGFDSAKVYIGTTSNFTPTDSGTSANKVDILDFANGQNSIYIGIGTVVNSSLTLAYDTDYYVKIKTTNGDSAQDSEAIAATGNPVRMGKVSSSGIVEVKADKITTGTLQSNSTITAGDPSGKRVVISGGSTPIEVYGSGNTSVLTFDSSGNLEITGTIKAKAGYFDGAVSINGDGGAMKIGKEVDPTSTYDGLYMGTNNYWYNDGVFKVGNGSKNLSFENGNLSLVNTATVGATGGQPGNSTSGSVSITTTIGTNGLISILSNSTSYYNFTDSAIKVGTAVSRSSLNPASISTSLDDAPNGVDFIGSSFSIFHDGIGRVNFLLGDGSTYNPIKYTNFDFSTSYDSDYIYGLALGGDATRSLVVYSDGTQYVGHRNYYGSSSSATMANATFGVDGDFYFSTNES